MNKCPLCKSADVQVCSDFNNPQKSFAKCRECQCQAPLISWEKRGVQAYHVKPVVQRAMRHVKANDRDTAIGLIEISITLLEQMLKETG